MFDRNKYSKMPIEDINIAITVHERMIAWYQDYIERKGEYDYVNEQINKLYNSLAEYLIARDIHIEG
jgi:hypothetical protein